MRPLPSNGESWALIERRLGLDRSELRAIVAQPLSWWQESARVDEFATALLSALAARDLGGRLRILTLDVPHVIVAEQGLLARAVEKPVRDALRLDHARLRRLVPYPVSSQVRLLVLRALPDEIVGIPSARHGLLRLAAELAEVPGRVVPTSALPSELFDPFDGDLLSCEALARRVARAGAEEAALLPIDTLPGELRAWAKALGPPFVRRLCHATTFTAVLLCGFASATRRRPSLRALRDVMDRADELALLADHYERDPLSAGAWLVPSLHVSAEAVDDLDDLMEARILAGELALLGAGTSHARSVRGTRGVAGLRALLLAAEATGAIVEELPARRAGGGERRFCGVEDDEMVLSAAKAADVAAFGHRLLGKTDPPEAAMTWAMAWSTGCRPKESLPCKEDFVEVAGGYLVYLDRNTGKTGARVLYLPALAADAFSIDPDRFPRRNGREELPDGELRGHRELLDAGCRLVRAAWLERYEERLPNRTAYFIRHAVADVLRPRIAEMPWLLAHVLGHQDVVQDAPYSHLSREEHAVMLVGQCEAVRSYR